MCVTIISMQCSVSSTSHSGSYYLSLCIECRHPAFLSVRFLWSILALCHLSQFYDNNDISWPTFVSYLCHKKIMIMNNKLIIEHKLCQGQNLNQKWSGIRIWISRLIWIQIQMSAGSLTICCAFIVSVSHFAKCRKNRPVTDCMRNAKKSMIPYSTAARQNGKVNQKSKNPHPYSDKHQNLITSRGSHFALSFFTR